MFKESEMTPAKRQADQLADVAAVLSPGMATVLEQLVTAYLNGTQVNFNHGDNMLLAAAAFALGTVNRTPGAAQQIGRDAAHAVAHSPHAKNLLSLGSSVSNGLGLKALQDFPKLRLGSST